MRANCNGQLLRSASRSSRGKIGFKLIGCQVSECLMYLLKIVKRFDIFEHAASSGLKVTEVFMAGPFKLGSGKFASCHDFRRSFGTRWARRIMPAELKLLKRHSSIETAMKYYVGIEADDIAAGLWASCSGGNTVKPTVAATETALHRQ